MDPFLTTLAVMVGGAGGMDVMYASRKRNRKQRLDALTEQTRDTARCWLGRIINRCSSLLDVSLDAACDRDPIFAHGSYAFVFLSDVQGFAHVAIGTVSERGFDFDIFRCDLADTDIEFNGRGHPTNAEPVASGLVLAD